MAFPSVPMTNAMSVWPRRRHRKRPLVASQTRLDGSQTDSCRRPCRLIFTQISSIPTNAMSWRLLWCRHDRLGSSWWSEGAPEMMSLSFKKHGRILWDALSESPKKPQKQEHKTSVGFSNLWKSTKIDSLFSHSLKFHSPIFHLPCWPTIKTRVMKINLKIGMTLWLNRV